MGNQEEGKKIVAVLYTTGTFTAEITEEEYVIVKRMIEAKTDWVDIRPGVKLSVSNIVAVVETDK